MKVALLIAGIIFVAGPFVVMGRIARGKRRG
jgi:hypothetical protein